MTRKFRFYVLNCTAVLAMTPALVYAQTPDTAADANIAASTNEIIVTAQKRGERLADTPVPVTAITAESLVTNGQVNVQDYASKVPGIALNASNGGVATVSIRGLTTGGGNPTTGIVIDDVAIGSLTGFAGGRNASIPNLNPRTLQRVEVLRGPQGTLYGASSLGGLMKFVTRDPSTSRVSGAVDAGVTMISEGEGTGYRASADVNIPLSSEAAILASGFYRKDPGYIDNILTGQKDINEKRSWGAHVSALWQPSDDFTVKLGFLHQRDEADGWDRIAGDNGNDFGQRLINHDTRDSSAGHNELTLLTARVSAAVGAVQLDSITAYLKRSAIYNIDFNHRTVQTYFGGNGGFDVNTATSNKFSQELRASIPVSSNVDLLVAGYYANEVADREQSWIAADALTGNILTGHTPSGVPTIYVYNGYWRNTAIEKAVFANLTWKVTDRLELQMGGRKNWNEQGQTETDLGPTVFNDPDTYVDPLNSVKDSPFVYLAAAKFEVTPDIMTYARLSSGYRAGGANVTCKFFNTPCSYKPDKTQNIELGLKGDIIDQYLFADISLYNISWRDIQLSVPIFDAQGNFLSASFGNGSKARSRGVELSLVSRPARGVVLSGWVVRNEAILTDDLPTNAVGTGGYGVKGDPLPYSAKWSANVGVDYDAELTDALTGRVGGSMSYVGSRFSTFPSRVQNIRYNLPAYTTFDFHIGLRYNESWTLDAYVNNITDKRGVIDRGTGRQSLSVGGTGLVVNVIQPRTIGVTLGKTF